MLNGGNLRPLKNISTLKDNIEKQNVFSVLQYIRLYCGEKDPADKIQILLVRQTEEPLANRKNAEDLQHITASHGERQRGTETANSHSSALLLSKKTSFMQLISSGMAVNKTDLPLTALQHSLPNMLDQISGDVSLLVRR